MTTADPRRELHEDEVDQLVVRGLRFLRGAGTRPAVMRLLEHLGYSEEEHYEGWTLLLSLSGYSPSGEAPLVDEGSPAQACIAELDEWSAGHLARARAALHRAFPAQEEYLFNSLEAGPGVAAVEGVRTFLQRLDALAEGSNPRRAACREEDRAAVRLLERRHVIDDASVARLRDLVGRCLALSLAAVRAGESEVQHERQLTARRFRSWLEDWEATAAAGITRREHLLSLGLRPR